jgi:hypothetical protein
MCSFVFSFWFGIGTNFVSRQAIPEHPLDVLAYASKHGYIQICDKVAPKTLGLPLDDVRKKFGGQPYGFIAWVRYVNTC